MFKSSEDLKGQFVKEIIDFDLHYRHKLSLPKFAFLLLYAFRHYAILFSAIFTFNF